MTRFLEINPKFGNFLTSKKIVISLERQSAEVVDYKDIYSILLTPEFYAYNLNSL